MGEGGVVCPHTWLVNGKAFALSLLAIVDKYLQNPFTIVVLSLVSFSSITNVDGQRSPADLVGKIDFQNFCGFDAFSVRTLLK